MGQMIVFLIVLIGEAILILLGLVRALLLFINGLKNRPVQQHKIKLRKSAGYTLIGAILCPL